jgi:MFS-type transporter involved in bile tolerance (Atg22 family)
VSRHLSDSTGAPRGTVPWIAFDFLNSLIVVNGAVHFSAWLGGPGGVDPGWYSLVYVISSAVLLSGLPVLGAMIDRERHGRQVLFACFLGMVVLSVAVGLLGHMEEGLVRGLVALGVFGLMNIVYHASIVGYDWLLVHLRGVRSREDLRRTSGYGQGAGMAGSVAGSLLGIGLIAWLPGLGSSEPRLDMFFVLALLFLVSGGIDYVWLRHAVVLPAKATARGRTPRPWRTWIAMLARRPSLRRFFVAFLLANGVLTVEFNLAIYMQNVLGYGPVRTGIVFTVALLSATAGGVLYARGGVRHDTRRVLVFSLALMGPLIAALAWVPGAASFVALLVVIGVLYGILWSSCRAHLIELTPRALLGRSLAFFAIFERSACVLGPLVWTAVFLLPVGLELRFASAITAMGVMVSAGALVMLRDLRAARRAHA